MVKGLSGGAALEELTQMVRDLQIAHAQRDGGEQAITVEDIRKPAIEGLRLCISGCGATRSAAPGKTVGTSLKQ